MKKNDSGKIPLGIYIHIPFCIRKCRYCDFLSGPAGAGEQQTYVRALLKEIRLYEQQAARYQVRTIFFGGGTPSLLPGGQIGQILAAVRETFVVEKNAEISLEANPGTVTEEKLEQWQAAGVNRLSFGLQSADDRELAMLGRIHTYPQFLESWTLAEEAGFTDKNIDLMSALPGQTVRSWERTLRTAAALGPSHISAYGLIVEEGTPFYRQYGPDSPDHALLPDEDTEREMYALTRSVLKAYGYERYEISNYARPGFACRHNCGYWDGTEYLGFGTGASSYISETTDISETTNISKITDINKTTDTATLSKEPIFVRQRNLSNLQTYTEQVNRHQMPVEERLVLTRENRMEEFVFLGLRMDRGISFHDFQERFKTSFASVYGPLTDRLHAQGLIRKTPDGIRLTEYGIDISNYVLSQYLL